MGSDWRDQASAVRQGEELDTGQLESYLKARIPGLRGSLTIEQFSRGFSNLTYLLRFDNRELVLRRPPFGVNIKSAHDMGREHTILSHLVQVYPKVPQPLLYCQDEAVLGAPFYVMTRLKGVILRPEMPEAMLPSPKLMASIARALVDNLVELHAVDYRAAGLGELGHPQGYIRRQVEGWSKRYRNARTDDIREMERVAAWLTTNMPTESGEALIHNDYKYDNMVLDSEEWSKIVGVLDWEMATIGDPLMDLGTSLGYWVEATDPEEIQALRLSPTNLPGNPTREELVQRYTSQSGRDVPQIVFYYVYGLFKLAVIVQQIYYRYRQGFTQDTRFAGLIHAVRASAQMAVRAIENNRIN